MHLPVSNTLGATFAPLRPLADAGVIEAVATDARAAAAVVAAAETQVSESIAGRRTDRLLLVIASLGEAPRPRPASPARPGAGRAP